MKIESVEQEKYLKVGYLVEGMTCSDCERKITYSLNKLEGVKSAEADLGSSSVSFKYNPGVASLDKIRTTLKNLGYKTVDKKPPEGNEDQRDGCCS